MRLVAKNAFSLLASDVTRRFLGFISVAYLARTLGSESFGAVNLGFAALAYGMMFSSFGLNTLGTRETARGKSEVLVGEILSLKIAGSAVVFILVVIIALAFVRDPVLARLIVIVSTALFAQALLPEWYFQGKERMGIVSLGRTISPVVYVVLVLLAVRSAGDILMVGGAAVAGDVVAAIVLLWILTKDGVRLRWQFRPAAWKSLLSQSLPIAFGSTLAQLSINYPVIALGMFRSNTEVGIYSAASKLVFYVLMIDRVLSPMLIPAMARWSSMTHEQVAARLAKTLKWILAVGFPVAVGGTIVAHRIVALVFGPAYKDAAGVFRVFVWYFFLTILNTVYTNGLIAFGLERLYSRVMAVSAVVFLTSVTVLTIWFGPLGSAFAVVASEALTLLMMRQRARHVVTTRPPGSLWKIIAATAAMGFSAVLFSNAHVLLVIVASSVVYGGLLLLTRAVTAHELLDFVRNP